MKLHGMRYVRIKRRNIVRLARFLFLIAVRYLSNTTGSLFSLKFGGNVMSFRIGTYTLCLFMEYRKNIILFYRFSKIVLHLKMVFIDQHRVLNC